MRIPAVDERTIGPGVGRLGHPDWWWGSPCRSCQVPAHYGCHGIMAAEYRTGHQALASSRRSRRRRPIRTTAAIRRRGIRLGDQLPPGHHLVERDRQGATGRWHLLRSARRALLPSSWSSTSWGRSLKPAENATQLPREGRRRPRAWRLSTCALSGFGWSFSTSVRARSGPEGLPLAARAVYRSRQASIFSSSEKS
jgi:hypothetical protein